MSGNRKHATASVAPDTKNGRGKTMNHPTTAQPDARSAITGSSPPGNFGQTLRVQRHAGACRHE